MNDVDRSYHVNRILCGHHIIELSGKVLYLSPSTPQDKLEADIIIRKFVYKNRFEKYIKGERALLAFLKSIGAWDDELQKEMDNIPTIIEDLKVSLFNSFFKSKDRDRFRKSLKSRRERLLQLTAQRHAYDHLTLEGVSYGYKMQYLMWKCLINSLDNSRFFKSEFEDTDTQVLDNVLSQFQDSLLNDGSIRELARTEPWKSIWIASKTENSLYGKPSADLTDEQRAIVLWSRMYDSVNDSMERPPSSIIEEDDMLDGWLIVQNRKIEGEISKKYGDKFVKDSKAGEVFIPVQSAEDARRVHSMNDPQSAGVRRQRLQNIKSKGIVQEQNLQDSQLRMRQQAIEQFKAVQEKAKGK